MRIECALDQFTLEVDWNRIRTKLIVYLKSCPGHHICCIRRPRYELWWPIMLDRYWLDAFTKRFCVVHWNSHSTSSTTSNKVRQIFGQTLVCVSIHLECWLNKARVEIVTWASVGVTPQQQFSYDLVLKLGSVNTIDVDSICIWCALGECEFNSQSNRI